MNNRIRWPALLALVLLQCQGRSERAFTEQVAARIREQNPRATVRVSGALTLEVAKPDGTTATHSLDNLWKECGSRPTACGEPLERYVRLAAEGMPKVENATALRVVLRDRGFLEQMQRAIHGARSPELLAKSQPVLRPFVADLLIGYVFDSDDGMQTVNRGALLELGLTEQGLHDRALANTEAALEAIPYEPVAPGSKVRIVSAGDSYEASRVLLHGRWRAIARTVRGDLLASAPARDAVIFTGSQEDVKGPRSLAHRISGEQHHQLSPTILRWTEASWVVFEDASRR